MVTVMQKCEYFRETKKKVGPKENAPAIVDLSPQNTKIEDYCTHPNSLKTSRDIGILRCNGDITKCPI